MADTLLPDKWVRKAIKDAFDGTVVSGNTINVFDFSVLADTYPDNHVLISTQINVPMVDFCGRGWEHTVQIDITTTYRKNSGSRQLLDEIAEALLPVLDTLDLDMASGMNIVRRSISFPGDLRESDAKNLYFRKIISVELEVR